jgi:hypothetical protein
MMLTLVKKIRVEPTISMSEIGSGAPTGWVVTSVSRCSNKARSAVMSSGIVDGSERNGLLS